MSKSISYRIIPIFLFLFLPLQTFATTLDITPITLNEIATDDSGLLVISVANNTGSDQANAELIIELADDNSFIKLDGIGIEAINNLNCRKLVDGSNILIGDNLSVDDFPLVCTSTSLADGTSGEVQLDIKPKGTIPDNTNSDSFAITVKADGDGVLLSDLKKDIQIIPVTDLKIEVKQSTAYKEVFINDPYNYSVKVTNMGNNPAEGIKIQLPNVFDPTHEIFNPFGDTENSQWNCVYGTPSECSYNGTLGYNGDATQSLTIHKKAPNTPESLVEGYIVTSDTSDNNSGNNYGEANITVYYSNVSPNTDIKLDSEQFILTHMIPDDATCEWSITAPLPEGLKTLTSCDSPMSYTPLLSGNYSFAFKVNGKIQPNEDEHRIVLPNDEIKAYIFADPLFGESGQEFKFKTDGTDNPNNYDLEYKFVNANTGEVLSDNGTNDGWIEENFKKHTFTTDSLVESFTIRVEMRNKDNHSIHDDATCNILVGKSTRPSALLDISPQSGIVENDTVVTFSALNGKDEYNKGTVDNNNDGIPDPIENPNPLQQISGYKFIVKYERGHPNYSNSYIYGESDQSSFKTSLPHYGVYSVKLVVMDSGTPQETFSNIREFTVTGNLEPKAIIKGGGNLEYLPNERILLTSESYDRDDVGAVLEHQWESHENILDSGATLESYEVSFAVPGVYDVKLTVTDNDNLSDHVTKKITVVAPKANNPPVAHLIAPSHVYIEPNENETTVYFDATGTMDTDGDSLLYKLTYEAIVDNQLPDSPIDIPAANPTTPAKFNHSFEEGKYLITLTTTEDRTSGELALFDKKTYELEVIPANISIEPTNITVVGSNPFEACPGLTVNYKVDQPESPYFGEFIWITHGSAIPSIASGAYTSVTYDDIGDNQGVQLVYESLLDGTRFSQTFSQINILDPTNSSSGCNSPPIPKFTWTPVGATGYTLYAPISLELDMSKTSDPDGDLLDCHFFSDTDNSESNIEPNNDGLAFMDFLIGKDSHEITLTCDDGVNPPVPVSKEIKVEPKPTIVIEEISQDGCSVLLKATPCFPYYLDYVWYPNAKVVSEQSYSKNCTYQADYDKAGIYTFDLGLIEKGDETQKVETVDSHSITIPEFNCPGPIIANFDLNKIQGNSVPFSVNATESCSGYVENYIWKQNDTPICNDDNQCSLTFTEYGTHKIQLEARNSKYSDKATRYISIRRDPVRIEHSVSITSIDIQNPQDVVAIATVKEGSITQEYWSVKKLDSGNTIDSCDGLTCTVELEEVGKYHFIFNYRPDSNSPSQPLAPIIVTVFDSTDNDDNSDDSDNGDNGDGDNGDNGDGDNGDSDNGDSDNGDGDNGDGDNGDGDNGDGDNGDGDNGDGDNGDGDNGDGDNGDGDNGDGDNGDGDNGDGDNGDGDNGSSIEIETSIDGDRTGAIPFDVTARATVVKGLADSVLNPKWTIKDDFDNEDLGSICEGMVCEDFTLEKATSYTFTFSYIVNDILYKETPIIIHTLPKEGGEYCQDVLTIKGNKQAVRDEQFTLTIDTSKLTCFDIKDYEFSWHYRKDNGELFAHEDDTCQVLNMNDDLECKFHYPDAGKYTFYARARAITDDIETDFIISEPFIVEVTAPYCFAAFVMGENHKPLSNMNPAKLNVSNTGLQPVEIGVYLRSECYEQNAGSKYFIKTCPLDSDSNPLCSGIDSRPTKIVDKYLLSENFYKPGSYRVFISNDDIMEGEESSVEEQITLNFDVLDVNSFEPTEAYDFVDMELEAEIEHNDIDLTSIIWTIERQDILRCPEVKPDIDDLTTLSSGTINPLPVKFANDEPELPDDIPAPDICLYDVTLDITDKYGVHSTVEILDAFKVSQQTSCEQVELSGLRYGEEEDAEGNVKGYAYYPGAEISFTPVTPPGSESENYEITFTQILDDAPDSFEPHTLTIDTIDYCEENKGCKIETCDKRYEDAAYCFSDRQLIEGEYEVSISTSDKNSKEQALCAVLRKPKGMDAVTVAIKDKVNYSFYSLNPNTGKREVKIPSLFPDPVFERREIPYYIFHTGDIIQWDIELNYTPYENDLVCNNDTKLNLWLLFYPLAAVEPSALLSLHKSGFEFKKVSFNDIDESVLAELIKDDPKKYEWLKALMPSEEEYLIKGADTPLRRFKFSDNLPEGLPEINTNRGWPGVKGIIAPGVYYMAVFFVESQFDTYTIINPDTPENLLTFDFPTLSDKACGFESGGNPVKFQQNILDASLIAVKIEN